MAASKDAIAAFPFANNAKEHYNWVNKGMTLRDYFAAKAMQTLAADESSSSKNIARAAYEIADAMLEVRYE